MNELPETNAGEAQRWLVEAEEELRAANRFRPRTSCPGER
jgi:hypothetical protein